MQTLDSTKTKVYAIWRGALKVVYFSNLNSLSVNLNLLCKQIFGRASVQEIIFCLFDNVGMIDKKQKIPISLLIKI